MHCQCIQVSLTQGALSNALAPGSNHAHRFCVHSGLGFAGVIFWQWGFAPYVSEEFLEGCMHCQAIQVSSSDGVFKNIIAPAADYAHKMALKNSPVAECAAGMLCSSSSAPLAVHRPGTEQSCMLPNIL